MHYMELMSITHISLLLLNIYCYLFCTIIIKNKMSTCQRQMVVGNIYGS